MGKSENADVRRTYLVGRIADGSAEAWVEELETREQRYHPDLWG